MDWERGCAGEWRKGTGVCKTQGARKTPIRLLAPSPTPPLTLSRSRDLWMFLHLWRDSGGTETTC